jgi:hypothetical protein
VSHPFLRASLLQCCPLPSSSAPPGFAPPTARLAPTRFRDPAEVNAAYQRSSSFIDDVVITGEECAAQVEAEESILFFFPARKQSRKDEPARRGRLTISLGPPASAICSLISGSIAKCPRLPKLASAEPPTAGPLSGGRSMARAIVSCSSVKDAAYRFAPYCFMTCLPLLGSEAKPKDSFARGADQNL